MTSGDISISDKKSGKNVASIFIPDNDTTTRVKVERGNSLQVEIDHKKTARLVAFTISKTGTSDESTTDGVSEGAIANSTRSEISEIDSVENDEAHPTVDSPEPGNTSRNIHQGEPNHQYHDIHALDGEITPTLDNHIHGRMFLPAQGPRESTSAPDKQRQFSTATPPTAVNENGTGGKSAASSSVEIRLDFSTDTAAQVCRLQEEAQQDDSPLSRTKQLPKLWTLDKKLEMARIFLGHDITYESAAKDILLPGRQMKANVDRLKRVGRLRKHDDGSWYWHIA